ncbi:MAG: 2-amino-4-hydroxy-6-hydroxymethyldihydropteridine diphosphokinase [Calditrichaeota bacterium]|nr:MAG: 2-amino-4-hydroxy-6-hydroxymethyldihydropteridine diphosphokinase [Calditrichota bacterium]
MSAHKHIFLGLGSNVGDRLNNLREAIQRISSLPNTHIIKMSSIYETEPVGFKDQGLFYNMALEISTKLSPEELLDALKEIEKRMGRIPTVRWGPRIIDIDILYWDQEVMETPRLKIPHAEIENRRFVLETLNEIAPDFKAPPRWLEIHSLLEQVKDKSWVQILLPKENFNFIH